jgi:hypothetical protein
MFGWTAKQIGKMTREIVDISETIYEDMASMPNKFSEGYKKSNLPTRTEIIIEEIKNRKAITHELQNNS